MNNGRARYHALNHTPSSRSLWDEPSMRRSASSGSEISLAGVRIGIRESDPGTGGLRLKYDSETECISFKGPGDRSMLVPLEEILLKDHQDGSISIFFVRQFRRKHYTWDGVIPRNNDDLHPYQQDLIQELHMLCFVDEYDPVTIAAQFVRKVKRGRQSIVLPQLISDFPAYATYRHPGVRFEYADSGRGRQPEHHYRDHHHHHQHQQQHQQQHQHRRGSPGRTDASQPPVYPGHAEGEYNGYPPSHADERIRGRRSSSLRSHPIRYFHRPPSPPVPPPVVPSPPPPQPPRPRPRTPARRSSEPRGVDFDPLLPRPTPSPHLPPRATTPPAPQPPPPPEQLFALVFRRAPTDLAVEIRPASIRSSYDELARSAAAHWGLREIRLFGNVDGLKMSIKKQEDVEAYVRLCAGVRRLFVEVE